MSVAIQEEDVWGNEGRGHVFAATTGDYFFLHSTPYKGNHQELVSFRTRIARIARISIRQIIKIHVQINNWK